MMNLTKLNKAKASPAIWTGLTPPVPLGPECLVRSSVDKDTSILVDVCLKMSQHGTPE